MAGHVYLIGSRKYNWYKIGKSSNAAIRVSDLGILLPFRIEVIAVWKVENHHAVEKLLHEKYAERRVNGEWFTFSAAHVKSLVATLRELQVPVAAGFSNIPESIKEYHKRLGLDENLEAIEPEEKNKGVRTRISQLVKQNHAFKEEIKRLLGQTASTLSVQ